MPKLSFAEEHIIGGIEGFITFPTVNCPKVNVIARVEFELAYFKATLLDFGH